MVFVTTNKNTKLQMPPLINPQSGVTSAAQFVRTITARAPIYLYKRPDYSIAAQARGVCFFIDVRKQTPRSWAHVFFV